MDGGSFGISNGPEYPPWYREERDVCPGIVMVICYGMSTCLVEFLCLVLDDCFYSKQQGKRERKLDLIRKNLKIVVFPNVTLKEKRLESKWGLDDHGQRNRGHIN